MLIVVARRGSELKGLQVGAAGLLCGNTARSQLCLFNHSVGHPQACRQRAQINTAYTTVCLSTICTGAIPVSMYGKPVAMSGCRCEDSR
jgi:hypothetical protein